MQRTYQPSRKRRNKTHGFRSRMATKNGRAVLSRRRAKGRKRLTSENRWKIKPRFRSLSSRAKIF